MTFFFLVQTALRPVAKDENKQVNEEYCRKKEYHQRGKGERKASMMIDKARSSTLLMGLNGQVLMSHKKIVNTQVFRKREKTRDNVSRKE